MVWNERRRWFLSACCRRCGASAWLLPLPCFLPIIIMRSTRLLRPSQFNFPTTHTHTHTQNTELTMWRLSSSSFPSSVLRLFLLAAYVLSSSAAPFLLRGDASATATVMEREKQWFDHHHQQQQQQQQEWPQKVTQYRGEYRGGEEKEGGREGKEGRSYRHQQPDTLLILSSPLC